MEHTERPYRFGRKIQCIAKHFQRLADENLVKESLTLAQLRVIATISRSEGPVYQRELEKDLGIRRSSVTALLQNMEKSGILVRTGREDDGRVKVLALTEKGKGLDERLRSYIHTLEEDLMRGFSPEERKTLADLLDRLSENMESMERSRL